MCTSHQESYPVFLQRLPYTGHTPVTEDAEVGKKLCSSQSREIHCAFRSHMMA
jgi:hypothetical protein